MKTAWPASVTAPHADKLLAGIADPDERLDELTGLVHLSATSDGFGCDVVGLVTLDGPARSVMMEVKSIQSGRPSRRCMVSRWAWETAKRLGRDFALVTVARDRVEVLLDPTHLADLTATPDGYLVEYRASTKPTTESDEHEVVVVTVT